GLAATRAKAQAMILAGGVDVGGRRIDKAGTLVDSDAQIRLAEPAHPFVSRGGVKLAAALDRFGIDVAGQVCLDVGASTGGFTDCLLHRGAARVYAIDVGYGQLDAKLRNDPRVVVREKVNARFLGPEHVPEPAAFAALDLSFISARLVLPVVLRFLGPGSSIVVLVKPQFEAGRGEGPGGGVIRSGAARTGVAEEGEGVGVGV